MPSAPVIIAGVIIVIVLVIVVFVVYSLYSAPAAKPAPAASTYSPINQAPGVAAPGVAAPALPNPFSVCEDKISGYALSCPSGKINVTGAKYGRYDGNCVHPVALANTPCAGKDVTTELASRCNGQSSCKLPATGNVMFGDSCPNIFKQLTGTYTCQ